MVAKDTPIIELHNAERMRMKALKYLYLRMQKKASLNYERGYLMFSAGIDGFSGICFESCEDGPSPVASCDRSLQGSRS